jgi:hypothetical protein
MTDIGLDTFINIFAYAIRLGFITIVLKYKQRLERLYVSLPNYVYVVPAKTQPYAPVVITLFVSLKRSYNLILVLHILTIPRLSYSGQISPILIILAANSVDASELAMPVPATLIT